MKFTYIDGEKICLFSDGAVTEMESAYVKRYRENELRSQKNREWKKRTENMLFDGMETDEGGVLVKIVSACSYDGEKIAYAFSVGESAFLYYKYLNDEKQTEAHILSSNEETFSSLSLGKDGFAVSMKKGYSADIAVVDARGDYKRLTDGDSLDENPSFTFNGDILFNSYAVARDEYNEFVQYMPSEIYRFNVLCEEIETVLSDENYSFVKPIEKDGALYCIRLEKEKEKKKNIFLTIILIPVRIVQAIIGFISLFVNIFAGKPLVDSKSEKYRSGGGAVKQPRADERTVAIHNYLVNVNEQLEKNAKEDGEAGFAPRSFKLMKYENGNAEVLASGVLDYAVLEDGEIIFTNGKKIFCLKEGKKTKLLNVSFCLNVGV